MNYLKEHKTALRLALLVALLTTIPYLVGFGAQGEDWRFTGFVVGVEDGNSYIAKMLRGASGEWLFRTPYSTAEQQGVIAFLPYLLLGKLTSQPAQHEQLVAIYQIFRIAGIILAAFASWDFLSLFLQKDRTKLWALALILLGGGCGWLLVLLQQKHFAGSVPLEFISPESFGFLALLGFPHLAVARALFLWGLTAFLRGDQGYQAGAFWLGAGFFQPMVVVIAWAVVSTHTIICFLVERALDLDLGRSTWKTRVTKTFQAVLVSAPIVVYTLVFFLTDPYLRGWAAQNQLPSPHPLHYLIAYGLFLPVLGSGLRRLWDRDRDRALLLFGWILILPILVYAPVGTQRRLAEGIWVALVVGSMAWLDNRPSFSWEVRCYLSLAFPSTLILLAGGILTASHPAAPAFRPAAEIAMYQALGQEIEDQAVVLASFEISNSLPAWIPVTVVYGHGPESVNLPKLGADPAAAFTSGSRGVWTLIQTYGVDYLVWGPADRSDLGWKPGLDPGWDRIYDQDGYAVYKVNKWRPE